MPDPTDQDDWETTLDARGEVTIRARPLIPTSKMEMEPAMPVALTDLKQIVGALRELESIYLKRKGGGGHGSELSRRHKLLMAYLQFIEDSSEPGTWRS